MNSTALLKIVVQAKDEASSQLKGLAAVGQKLQSEFSQVGVVAGVAFGLVAAGLYSVVKSAADAEAVQAQLNAVLASTGGVAGVTAQAANDLAESLSRVTAFEDEAILSAENMLLTFTNISGTVFPEATETVLNMSQALGQDLQSSAIQLGKALNNPIDGITALSRVGVNFTEKQKDMIKSLQESGRGMEAQKIILAELATEFGGSARRAAETFDGQMKQLKNSIGNIGESIGNVLLPITKELTQVVLNVTFRIKEWVDKHPDLTRAILAVVTAIGVMAGLVAVVTAGIVAFGAAMAAATPIAAALGLTVAGLLGPIGWAIAGVAALAGGSVYAASKLGAFDKNAADAGKTTDETAKSVKNFGEMSKESASKISQMAEKTKEAKEKIAELQKEIAKTIADGETRDKSNRQTIADAIIEQQKNIAEISGQIEQKKAEIKKIIRDGDGADQLRAAREELDTLTWQHAREQEAFQKKANGIQGLSAELAEAERRSSLTAFERKMEDLAKQRELDKKEVAEKLLKQQEELKQLKLHLGSIANENKKLTSTLEAEQNKQAADVEATTARILASYARRPAGGGILGGSISSSVFTTANSTPSVMRVNDAVLRPDGTIVETSPEDYLFATKNPAALAGGNGGVVINITGNTLLSENSAREIGDLMASQFQRLIR